ncbi:hypothetical protein [Simkania sp.]|uniref:hypothetical protein n=1 Tax=Simkania sp. TaxID=34094 RepID=UPI003B52A400
MNLKAIEYHRDSYSIPASIKSAFDSDFLDQVSFEISDSQEHKALCRYEERVIVLGPRFDQLSEPDQFAYVAFELYNLMKARQFEAIIQSSDSVDVLVQNIEQLEHGSALQTQALAREVLGTDVDYELKHVDRDFDSFYAFEQLKGHSQWLAKKYRPQERYLGTIAAILERMTQADKESVYTLLHARHHDPERFEKLYQVLTRASKTDPSWANVYACAQAIFPSSEGM